MKSMLTLLCLAFACTTLSYSQETLSGLSGILKDDTNQPIPFADIILYIDGDTNEVVQKVAYSREDGSFQMEGLQAGTYVLKASSLGFEAQTSAAFSLINGEKKVLEPMVLAAASNNLEEATVTAEKAMIEVQPDKTVFNVQNSISASGSDALELLRKAPGVVVDGSDNILILGKTGVQIYIDGKPSPLDGEDLTSYLKGLSSNQVEAIEIITNPSARWDAEGNAGIINIRLVKDKNLGTNVNLNAGVRYGENARYEGGFSLNHRNKVANIFGNYSVYGGQSKSTMNFVRRQAGNTFVQSAYEFDDYLSHNYKAGVDLFFGKRHTLGVLFQGGVGEDEEENVTRTNMVLGTAPDDPSLLIADNREISDRSNYNGNLNYRFRISDKSTLSMDADYGSYVRNRDLFQPNTYFDPVENTVDSTRNFTNETMTDIEIATFKADYETSILDGKLEVGIKTSMVQTDNEFDFFQHFGDDKVLDIDRTNQFAYEENVNAAYVSFQRALNPKWKVQLGLRTEHTNSTGTLTSLKETENDKVERNYIDFFPSAGLTYTPSQKHQWAASYSRRIDRPNYHQLNPFEYKLDELTFQKGNPFLNPQYTNSFQVSHTYNYSMNISLNYSHTADYFAEITDTLNSRAAFIKQENLADRKNLSLTIGTPLPITKWWSTYTNFVVFYTNYKANLGNERIVNTDAYAYNLYHQQTFQLPGDFALEISGWYASPGIWGGTFETDAMFSIDAGLQKKFLEGRGTVRLGITDIFRGQGWSGTSNFGGLDIEAGGEWESRQVKLNVSYLLGNNKMKNSRRRKTGSEEEAKRVGG